MEINLSGKTALITGGSLGLGFAMAKALSQAGSNVIIVARNEKNLKAAHQELEIKSSGEIFSYRCDVQDATEIDNLFNHISKNIGPVDILINNAGRSAAKPFHLISDEEWRDDIDLKLMAAIRLSRLVWGDMKQKKWGRIINLLNVYAKAPGAETAPTSVTRAAGMALTKVLSAEGARHNILVNAMLIGFIESDQIKRRYEASGSNDSLETFIKEAGSHLPMGRMGTAEECANLALFLASDKASYITGCAINMDGGLSKVP